MKTSNKTKAFVALLLSTLFSFSASTNAGPNVENHINSLQARSSSEVNVNYVRQSVGFEKYRVIPRLRALEVATPRLPEEQGYAAKLHKRSDRNI